MTGVTNTDHTEAEPPPKKKCQRVLTSPSTSSSSSPQSLTTSESPPVPTSTTTATTTVVNQSMGQSWAFIEASREQRGGFPSDWKVLCARPLGNQTKYQITAPNGKVFMSKVQALNYLKPRLRSPPLKGAICSPFVPRFALAPLPGTSLPPAPPENPSKMEQWKYSSDKVSPR